MKLKSAVMDRRAFLGGTGLLAGAVVATSLVPLSVVHAVPGNLGLLASADAAPGAQEEGAAGSWHVDDICGHWPPYAHPIAYGRHAEASSSMLAQAAPIDHIFLI